MIDKNEILTQYCDEGRDIDLGIWNLVSCSGGGYFPSYCKSFSSSLHAEAVNREVLSTMGFRLFYGLHPDGTVIEFVRKGQIGQKDLACIREMGVTQIWWSTFTGKNWVIAGTLTVTEHRLDLSPMETMREAWKWRKVY